MREATMDQIERIRGLGPHRAPAGAISSLAEVFAALA